MSTTEKAIRNGVDTATLFATLDAVKADTELARFQFRATNRWLSGTHNRSTIHGYRGAKQELTHREPFTFDADHPPVLVGSDNGPTPVEYLLHALAACLHHALHGGADERTALAGYQRQRDQALRDVFELTCAMASYPPITEFVELQKRLARAIDVEATALATRTVPGERTLARAHTARADDSTEGEPSFWQRDRQGGKLWPPHATVGRGSLPEHHGRAVADEIWRPYRRPVTHPPRSDALGIAYEHGTHVAGPAMYLL